MWRAQKAVGQPRHWSWYHWTLLLAVLAASGWAWSKLEQRISERKALEEAFGAAGLAELPATARGLSVRGECDVLGCTTTVRFSDEMEAIERWKVSSPGMPQVLMSGGSTIRFRTKDDEPASVTVNDRTGEVAVEVDRKDCGCL